MEPQKKCINITRWPGQGDLYVRIDPDRYYPITYTLSALVTPVPAPMRGLYTPPPRPSQVKHCLHMEYRIILAFIVCIFYWPCLW